MGKESSRKHKIAVSAPSLTSRGRGQAKWLVRAGPQQGHGAQSQRQTWGRLPARIQRDAAGAADSNREIADYRGCLHPKKS